MISNTHLSLIFSIVTSKEYEMELEEMNLESEKRIDELETDYSKVKKDMQKLSEKYEVDKKELSRFEKENE